MCGIVGYIGTQKASPILLAGLSKLEYRGYDSAGIATVEGNDIKILKDKGRVENLYKLEKDSKPEGTIGIAHTRWATHGIPSKTNSHPHMDNSETFAVVHNGIIENYLELKRFLESEGYHFISDTDTEVVPNLIHYFYNKDSKDDDLKLLRALKSTCDKLIGSFSLEVLSKFMPNNMLVVRKDSPLVIGKGIGENYIASDIPAILSYTKEFFLLENFEYVILSKDNVKFYDTNLKEFEKKSTTITWDAMAADKGSYDDYMLKEIHEQPTAIRETIGTKLNGEKCEFPDLNLSKEYLENINRIYIVACGTAMHAALGAKATFEHFCKIPTEIDVASEFRYRAPLIDEKSLCIFVSQSGETADTLAALKLCKEFNATTISTTNVVGSSIAREADYALYTHAGPEIAVASTKAYTSQVTLLNLLAIHFAEKLNRCDTSALENLKKEMTTLPAKIEEILKHEKEFKNIAIQMYKEKDVFYLGRGVDYTTAIESALKLKEISYIHSEAYAAGELKHGTIALIEKGINVIGILTDESLLKKTVSNIEEIITRGAITTIVITENLSKQIDKNMFNNVIVVPDTNTYLSPILAVVPLQLVAYYVSKEKGLDVDKPRNLAKSVTVE